jgi:membrane-associated phospholipid phosphatase
MASEHEDAAEDRPALRGLSQRRAEPAASSPLGARLASCGSLKLAVWLGLTVGICVPYFTLQRLGLEPGPAPPVLAIEEAIPFAPGWIWAYVSLAILVPLAPSLATSRELLLRYARGLALLCGICFVIFFLNPVAGPRPALMPEHALYGFIVSVDRPSNSLPSLHAGLTAYSLLYIWRVLRPDLGGRGRSILGLGTAIWAILILYSTLATKQHWLLDLPAGVLVAWVAHRCAWQGVDRHRGGEESDFVEQESSAAR